MVRSTAWVQPAVQFESVMADVKKVVNFDTPEQFGQMSKDVLLMSTRIPMAADGIGAIVAAAGQSGIAREGSCCVLPRTPPRWAWPSICRGNRRVPR